jgi:hypothetical protein
MQLDRPAPAGDQFSFDTHVGALAVFEVLEHVPPQVTKVSEKPQDSIRANVYIVSPQGTVAEQFLNTLVWPRIVVSRLRQSVGKTVVGLIEGQPNVKKDGRNIPYDLGDPNDAMMDAAARAMASVAQSTPPPPAANAWGQPPVQQPATQAPWGQPPVQQGPPPGWGQQQQPAVPAGPPPGWGQPPVQQPQQPTAAGPWGQPPADPYGQQQLPQAPPQEERPPWEQQAPPAQAPWGGQQ